MSEELNQTNWKPSYNSVSDTSKSKEFYQFRQQKRIEYYKNKQEEENDVMKFLKLKNRIRKKRNMLKKKLKGNKNMKN